MRLRPSTTAAIAATAVILNRATTLAAPASYCAVADEICFQWGVPEAVASSGSGNVYFQLRAPTSYSWVGLGIGSRMEGADMFIMYENGKGNVTLSTRQGLNHIMPTYKEKTGVELLAGSGVIDGHMVANIRCGDCSELSVKGSNGWLSAWKAGSSLASTDTSARISYHDSHDLFSVDFAKAAVSSDTNPFVGGGNKGNNTGSGSNGSGSGAVVQDKNPNEDLLHAHGIIMSVVFLIGYPVGSMVMPMLGKWLLHASWQMVVFLLMWAGFGAGYVLSRRLNLPVLGWLHHQHFLKHKKRGPISYAHIWYGRLLIVLGMINGGLGLQLAGLDGPFVITYCTILGIFAALYLGSMVIGVLRKRRAATPGSQSSMEQTK
ncbi:hypothetical protein QQS21_006191 [Conoideocrella luteorostrata]|uniref:Cellobiose dehydrogenase-like cytochrome domain-containing protein n=1 Tax=Conoideocrella luteorostrata TaxID=1105319 RepID=A0AAJ0CN21_9HYPO|nr:hypothetical protein QQS21_006191 [Conoideocrella luteorostrata]